MVLSVLRAPFRRVRRVDFGVVEWGVICDMCSRSLVLLRLRLRQWGVIES